MQSQNSKGEFPPLRILVIDPEEELCKYLRSELQAIHCQVEYCLNAHEGREMARRIQPDLIILELILPDMDGLEFCQHLHEEASLNKQPLLVLTQVNDPQMLQRYKTEAISMIMTKPFSLLELSLVIAFLTHRVSLGKDVADPHLHFEKFLQNSLLPEPLPKWLRPFPMHHNNNTFPCPFCGTELFSNNNFCLTCGNRVQPPRILGKAP